MIQIKKIVIEWGNSAGVYIPRKYLGKEALIQILEKPRLSTSYIYGIMISIECYGYRLIKPDNFKPELHNEKELKGYNIYNYNGEEIKIMLIEDIILELLIKKQDFRLIKGIPIIIYKYEKNIDYEYLINNLRKAKKIEFLGHLLDTTSNILKKYNLRNNLRKKLTNIIKKIGIKKKEIKFLNEELRRIYKKTKNPEKIESTKRDGIMKKWNIAYFPKQKEFEDIFEVYYGN